jgi:DNA-binding XRE family transcriptional regulator
MAVQKVARDHTRSHTVWLPRVRELRVARAELGVSVTAIAKDLGRSRSHVCDVINGRRTSNALASQIARYFGVPIEELFFQKDLENPDQASAA